MRKRINIVSVLYFNLHLYVHARVIFYFQFNLINYHYHHLYHLDTSFLEYLNEVYDNISTIDEYDYMKLKFTNFFYRNTNIQIIPLDWNIKLGDNATNTISKYFATNHLTNNVIYTNHTWIEVSRFSSNMITGIDRKWDEGLSHGPFIERLVPYGCWFHSTPGTIISDASF